MTVKEGKQMSIYDAAMSYRREGVPLVVLGGKEYGSGSSRDWAAKGTSCSACRAVIAESFERIHRSNLIGMGVLAVAVPRRGVGRVARASTGSEQFEHARDSPPH